MDLLTFLSSLAWPFVILVLVGWRFESEVRDILRRLKTIGPKGIETEWPVQRTSDPAKIDLSKEVLTEAAINSEPALQDKLQFFKSEITKYPEGERQARLTIALARTSTDVLHCLNYIAIFGSQISLLRSLHDGGESAEENAREFFKMAIEKYPNVHLARTFDAWLNFVIQQGYVSRTADKLKITSMGSDFLSALVRLRLSEHRIG